jgi:hypothetical protein
MHRDIGSHVWLVVEMGLASDWERLGESFYESLWHPVWPMPTETNIQVSRNKSKDNWSYRLQIPEAVSKNMSRHPQGIIAGQISLQFIFCAMVAQSGRSEFDPSSINSVSNVEIVASRAVYFLPKITHDVRTWTKWLRHCVERRLFRECPYTGQNWHTGQNPGSIRSLPEYGHMMATHCLTLLKRYGCSTVLLIFLVFCEMMGFRWAIPSPVMIEVQYLATH